MASMNIISLAVFLLLQLVSCDIKLDSGKINKISLLSETVKAFNKGLDYYQENIARMNLDAIYALRVAEAVFENTLYKTLAFNEPTTRLRWMKSLKSRTASLINQAIPFLKQSDHKYFKQVGFAVQNKWRIVRSFRKLAHCASNVTVNDVKNKTGDSMQSCLDEVHGIGGSSPCNFTKNCWLYLTSLNGYGYTLTHQILYFMFAQHINGCTRVINTRLADSDIPGGVNQMYDQLCCAIYPQMSVIETISDHDLNEILMDLYIEEGLICGILGYEDFLSVPRLLKLLNRQFPSGCYGDEQYNPKNRNQARLTPQLHRRQGKQLGGGCESHITGVSTGLLSVYIRWLTLTMA